ncbi:MBL fold metallo-hydrolase [Aquirhabdus parva]|uniref:MBL fold metallo-hydrolase n=1 Tax=Aquirhabdus parva TaxID=2283318 RepID=A0A345P340_9GAMM|nr:MBL fold metallo-hydrolase [Aquirhabdus parva]AXI01699.1 MBL fold metallo-hydrolase [Aquirhabdus parva]
MSQLRSIAILSSTLLTIAATSSAIAAPLKLDIYNPGKDAIFPVSSVLVTGKTDAILVDAQFGKSQAEKVIEKIKASGKKLTTIYISHGDPDYYFGLDTIKAAYPDAKVFATPQTVAHIKETVAGKLAFWGPKLGADAPKQTIIPDVLQGDSLTLDGKKLNIIDLKGNQPERSVVWIPSIKAIVGGVVVDGPNIHVWMADTQTPKSHTDWLTTLQTIKNLKPKTVVPGHYLPGAPLNLQSVDYTASYIKAFDEETPKAKDSAALIDAMKKRYPQVDDVSSLELSAKVAKGEMKW